MKITVVRKYMKEKYTIGQMMVNGTYFCDTMEPACRGLHSEMSEAEIREVKKKGYTAIPTGTYNLTLDVVSPANAKKKQYTFCQGKLPRLINVKGYKGILIHIGNFPSDTHGCILVGRNVERGKLLYSTVTFRELYRHIVMADAYHERVVIEIQ